MSLSAVIGLASEQGAWVNDPLDVVVRNAAPGGVGQGNKQKPSKCVLVDPKDPNQFLAAAWFGGNFAQYEDKLIRIAGKSNKVSIYRGKSELSIGKEGTVTLIGPAPEQLGGGQQPTPQGGNAPKTPEAPVGDQAAVFHRGMQKTALLWTHSYQYAQNVRAVLHPQVLPDDLFQSLVSSIFITAKDNGALMRQLPRPRAVDEKGLPHRYIADQPDPEAVKRAAEEAAKAAAEKARIAAEEAARNQQNLDEDVPF